jgi:hypothetical protein
MPTWFLVSLDCSKIPPLAWWYIPNKKFFIPVNTPTAAQRNQCFQKDPPLELMALKSLYLLFSNSQTNLL